MPGFTYKSYNFVDKDPIIDYLRTIVQNSQKTNKAIAEESGVTTTTISNMLYGKTRRPQAATINAILRALNHKLNISAIEAPMIIVPTAIEPVAIEPSRRRRLGAAKYGNVHHISAHKRRKK
jgi:transcriptional regulator with XRE-family HTH domain